MACRFLCDQRQGRPHLEHHHRSPRRFGRRLAAWPYRRRRLILVTMVWPDHQRRHRCRGPHLGLEPDQETLEVRIGFHLGI